MFVEQINTIEVDPTGLCNLACAFCPRSTFYPNTNNHMSMETAQLIIDSLKEINFTGEVSITGKGEPTLHNNFIKLVEAFARDKTWTMKINTNGKRFDQYKDVILKHFDYVIFNCYEMTEEQYLQKKEELAAFSNVKVKYRPNNIQWFEDSPRYTNRGGAFDTNAKAESGLCDVVFKKIFIDYNGIFRLCCEDWKHEIQMSTIRDQSIEDYVENNETLKQYRRKLVNGQRDMDPCQSCVYSIIDYKYGTTYEQMDAYRWLTEMENLGV